MQKSASPPCSAWQAETTKNNKRGHLRMIAENWPIGPNIEIAQSPESGADTLVRPRPQPGQTAIVTECLRCDGVAWMTNYDGDLFCITCGRPDQSRPRAIELEAPSRGGPRGVSYLLPFTSDWTGTAVRDRFQDVVVRMVMVRPQDDRSITEWTIECPVCGCERRTGFTVDSHPRRKLTQSWRFRCPGRATLSRRHATIIVPDREGPPGRWFPGFY
jgi:hypothetical protein